MSKSDRWGSAWEQCYVYFGLDDGQFEEEIACLRLAFYLASFGMFRASGKTRKLQLRDYAELVKVCRRARALRDKQPKELAKVQGNVEKFLRALSKSLEDLDVSATDTILSKIALGTTACMPAYDRFAKLTLRSNSIIATPSKMGLNAIYALRKSDLAKFGVLQAGDIPFMRALDIVLKDTGEELDKIKKAAKKQQD